MAAQRIDGKATAASLRRALAAEVAELKDTYGRAPGLHVVLVGDNPASQVYVRNKEKAAKEVGCVSSTHRLPKETSQAELLGLIEELNSKESVDGILVQLPLPEQLDEEAVTKAISPEKDVDGFHPLNMGELLASGKPKFVPCTPQGILRLLDTYGVELKGKRAVVIGRSTIVGKPVALLLLGRHATVTLCHSRTVDLPGVTREADVVVVAVGKPKLVKGDWLKPGAVVIDVGINRTDEGLCGDVDFESASEVASLITPVPGGVGPMTIAELLFNTVKAFKRHVGA